MHEAMSIDVTVRCDQNAQDKCTKFEFSANLKGLLCLLIEKSRFFGIYGLLEPSARRMVCPLEQSNRELFATPRITNVDPYAITLVLYAD